MAVKDQFPLTKTAEYLQAKLEAAGKKQAEIGRSLNWSKSQISRLFVGKEYPDIPKIPLLASALGVPPIELLTIVLQEQWPTFQELDLEALKASDWSQEHTITLTLEDLHSLLVAQVGLKRVMPIEMARQYLELRK